MLSLEPRLRNERERHDTLLKSMSASKPMRLLVDPANRPLVVSEPTSHRWLAWTMDSERLQRAHLTNSLTGLIMTTPLGARKL